MQPYNFSIGGNLPDPSQAFTSGMQQGNAVLQLDRQQQQQALELQAQQQALRAQEQYSAAVNEVLAKPSGAGYARLMTLRPKEAEGMAKAWAALSAEKQQAGLSDLTQWTAAVENGRPDLAITAMNARADMIDRDAGGKSAEGEALRAQAKILEADPTTGARLVLAPMLYAHPDGKRALDNITIQAGEARAAAKAPAELRTANAGAKKAEADATTAGVTAKFAESQAMADLEKKGWDIKALQGDIEFKKQSTRIAAMNADLARKKDGREAEELRLKIGEARGKLDDKVREKAGIAESGASAIDNMLNTIERVKKNPSLNDVLGSVEGRLPSLLSDTGADAIAMIETLGSQAFLAQIPNIKGMGALSNAEGEKLQSAFQNLGRTQSEAQFRANLDEASRLLKKGREALAKSSGVPLGKPDTPAAPGARPPIDSFFK